MVRTLETRTLVIVCQHARCGGEISDRLRDIMAFYAESERVKPLVWLLRSPGVVLGDLQPGTIHGVLEEFDSYLERGIEFVHIEDHEGCQYAAAHHFDEAPSEDELMNLLVGYQVGNLIDAARTLTRRAGRLIAVTTHLQVTRGEARGGVVTIERRKRHPAFQ